ncbi:MAG: PD-(D/E)XK nuclease family protein [Thermodesulfovibrionales bacterium]|nr:PD-(D/E)XK nuclease family protein [Thermodesulfovibrionales bacterium]
MGNGNGKTILTNSAINAFKSCARKYYWRYVREIEAMERPEALLLGTAIHGFLEAHYRQLPYTPPIDLAPKSQAILKGVREYYPILYLDDCDLFEPVAVEKIISGEILNPETGRPAREYSYGGKVDGLVVLKKDVEGSKAGDLLLLEHKTTTKVDENYFDRLQLDSQLRLYVFFLARELGAPIAGCLFNVILKPRLRPRKNESEEEYGHRLRLEMNWPEMYQRRFLRFSDQRLMEIQKELWDAKTLIAKARKENVFTMNSASCFDWHRRCDYFDLCASQDPEAAIKESGLFQHQEAHVELVTGPGEVLVEAAGEPF